jgi:ankyrin repeat protein
MKSLPPHLNKTQEDRLWTAVHSADVATAQSILEGLCAKPDTDVCQFRGITALHVASELGLDDLVDRLIAAGATVDQSSTGGFGDLVGETPLHNAAKAGHATICVKLIAAGAGVNSMQGVVRQFGSMLGALTLAAEHGHLEVVEVLLNAHADPNGSPPSCVNLAEVSLVRPLPAAIAASYVNIAEALILAGADLDLESSLPSGDEATARELILAAEDPDIRALL